MKQSLTVKETKIDQDLKVTVKLEFAATDPESQSNLFELIKMQGFPASAEIELFEEQPELFEAREKKQEARMLAKG